MDFVEVEVKCTDEFREILMAEMSELEYNTFMEIDTGFMAYIECDFFNQSRLDALFQQYSELVEISHTSAHVKEKNWNEEWEKNYDPIIIDDKCLVKASFHNIEKKYSYEVLINPRMSFGTGHHETTYLMGSLQLQTNHSGKKVLDIGCGTGILAILAAKLGAAEVLAIDNNDWAYSNALDNVILNELNNVEVRLGSIYESSISTKYDLVLANINRNVLLNELPNYIKLLDEGGEILISGFYEEDVLDMVELMDNNGYAVKNRKTKNRWSAIHFIAK
jgi:ribosomal protein L11 methyltransferase